MNDHTPAPENKSPKDFMHRIEKSAIWTVIGIFLLFSTAIIVTLVGPIYIDQTWISPSSPYQVQMYEVEDPNIYIGGISGVDELLHIQHLKQNFTLLSFKESEENRIIAPPDLEKYVTRYNSPTLKLTSRLLLLRVPAEESQKKSKDLIKSLDQEWKQNHPNWVKEGLINPKFTIWELYDPQKQEAFAYDPSRGFLQNWVDENFEILDETLKQPYHQNYGVVYAQNPQEYKISSIRVGDETYWRYDPDGKPVKDLDELMHLGMQFRSRKELISLGEHIYAIEGCWYCHTDQTRTLIQDVVLNGSDSFPAPPSSANEYIYQKITFPGTRRIGPDLSRVGIKRPSRDWHKSHFWSPKTASLGSIMPSFRHFFDNDPRGTNKGMGIPNYRFEAMYQYLMTKGTRITPPTQAWWLGKDPIQTKEIIEGKRAFK